MAKNRKGKHGPEPRITEKRHLYCVYRVTPKADGTERTQAEAYEMAGYSVKGSKQVTVTNACRLENLPIVKAKIEELRGQIRKKFEERAVCSSQRILEETANIALFDIADLYEKDGRLKNVHDMPEHARRAISSIEVMTTTYEYQDGSMSTKVKEKVMMNNKNTANDQFHKHYGHYEKHNEQLTDCATIAAKFAGEKDL